MSRNYSGFQKSLGRKYTNLSNEIKAYLQTKGMADTTNTVLIDELVFNIYLADQAKVDILTLGFKVGNKPNPSIAIYNTAMRNIQGLTTKIGMSPQERAKLKLKTEETDDLADILGA